MQIEQVIRKAQNNPSPNRTLPNTPPRTWLPQRPSTSHCEACGDTGWRPLTREEKIAADFKPGYDYSVPCEVCAPLRIDRQRAQMQQVSMLTTQEQDLRLKDIHTQGRADTTAIVQACREMVEREAFLLTIWGSNGNAKSAALVATVNEFLDRGTPAVYLPAYDMLNWIQEAIGSDGSVRSESAFDRLERLKCIRMLAIDEFQAVKITDWRLEQMRNLIDRRWRDGLDGRSFALLAMNEDPATLEARIWSRLQDDEIGSRVAP